MGVDELCCIWPDIADCPWLVGKLFGKRIVVGGLRDSML